ncbi:helix-turn-helix protein [Luteimonas cucumeris]|uniref:Helix-turn-helix protein n=1 Tax=Luteimonas cucumeris TaxID=985012 RepID=A0A562KY50_9GAMM|nr:helix-turn-helix transcriptional regulator [Luteimonas cucumeris]TWI00369.1 helix-turn-helix protein [Luteimonas cucumeris]
MVPDMKVDLNLVKRLREERAWSQEHLATVAGLSTRTIQRIETDGRASHESRLALAAAFGIAAERLVAVDQAAQSRPLREIIPDTLAWLDFSRRDVRVIAGMAAVFAAVVFIYQAGHAAGTFVYYVTH